MSAEGFGLHPGLAALIGAYRERNPPRTWSLIVTVFGDVALPRGEAIRLTDLTSWMEALGIEPGLVRTALSRLVSNGTLTRERDGRSAFYRVHPAAEPGFLAAADLIYGRHLPEPSGMMHLAVLEESSARSALRGQLGTQGFVGFAPNLMLRPGHIGHAVTGSEGALILDVSPNADLAKRAPTLWPLPMLAEGYRANIALANGLNPMPADGAFLARILLVHEFRRVVLKDPFLPLPLLPPDWPGQAARRAFDAALRQLSD